MRLRAAAVTVSAVLAAAWPTPAAAQEVARTVLPATDTSCDLTDLTNRLRWSHPLGAARSDGRQCLDQTTRWVTTVPMDGLERRAWRRAVGALAGSRDDACRRAAAVLVWLERTGVVSVWAPADTGGGLVFYGASYLTEEAAPLAVQFWARTFERPSPWLAGALAHEAFHVIRAAASEREATAFGEGCSRHLGPAPADDPETADAAPVRPSVP